MARGVGRGKRVVQGHVEDHRDDEHAEHIERAAGRHRHRHRAGLAPAQQRGHRQRGARRRRCQEAGLLGEALRRIAPDAPTTALASFSQLIMTLIAATVRHAITQNAKEAARILTLFKRMLPKNLAALEI